jgi:type II protein arginine methyltransferase
MLTSPITTPHFHSRVLTLLSSLQTDDAPSASITQKMNASPIVVSPLSPADTPLTPDGTASQIIGVTSSWIDLCSPDPVIADVSRQVLKLELSYAAFCGLTYVLIPGPGMRGLRSYEAGLVQYARAILDGLGQGPYMHLHIWLPMIDHSDDDRDEMGDLAPFARHIFARGEERPEAYPEYYPEDHPEDHVQRLELFGTWEAWDMIRSLCKYSSRLSIGKNTSTPTIGTVFPRCCPMSPY